MNIKKRYQQFRQWQQSPFHYEKSHEQHHCYNCDQEFEGRYCPTCGQKATAGPITWKSIHRGILEVWGMGSRSLPYTLLQLLGRPGYFMSDYINGRRQVSFPPVKMLVLVGLAIFLLDQWLHLDVFSADGILGFADEENGEDYPLNRLFLWLSTHYEWGMLFFFIIMALPTYAVFREAPRNTHHTMPQEFFIQVFNATQYLILLTFLGIIMKLLNLSTNEGTFEIEIFVLLPAMLLFNYKQLFGYSYRGTLWRIATCLLLWMAIVIFIVFSPEMLAGQRDGIDMVPFAVIILLAIGILHAVDILNNWKVKELHRGRFWRIFNIVFIVTAASFIILIVTILSFALFGGLTGETLKKVLNIKTSLLIILVVSAITLYILIKGMKKVKKKTAVALDSEPTADDMSVDEAND